MAPPSRRAPRRRTLVAALVLLAAITASACGDDGGEPVRSEAPGTATTGSTTVDESTSSSTPPRTGQAEAAVADLAERLGVDPDAVGVVSVEAVTWPNSSLGCPQPGFMYQQVLTEGVRIVLEVDGTRYSYHGGASGDPFYCATPEAPASVG